MAKKIFMGLLLATIVGTAAFAADFKLSAGAGGFIGGDFGGGTVISASGYPIEWSMTTPYFGGGGYAFFDATYAELSLGVFGGSGEGTYKYSYYGSLTSAEYDDAVTSFNIGLLGKYPFAINEKFSIFPAVGIDYQAMLSVKVKGNNVSDDNLDIKDADFSALWFKFGGGFDYALTSHLYLRGEALYGIRLASKAETDSIADGYAPAGISFDSDPLLGHGLTVKLAVGWAF